MKHNYVVGQQVAIAATNSDYDSSIRGPRPYDNGEETDQIELWLPAKVISVSSAYVDVTYNTGSWTLEKKWIDKYLKPLDSPCLKCKSLCRQQCHL